MYRLQARCPTLVVDMTVIRRVVPPVEESEDASAEEERAEETVLEEWDSVPVGGTDPDWGLDAMGQGLRDSEW
jgi:hypothetical protein